MKFLICLLNYMIGYMIGYIFTNIIMELIDRIRERKILNKIDKIRRSWYGYE